MQNREKMVAKVDWAHCHDDDDDTIIIRRSCCCCYRGGGAWRHHFGFFQHARARVGRDNIDSGTDCFCPPRWMSYDPLLMGSHNQLAIACHQQDRRRPRKDSGKGGTITATG